MNTAIQLEGHYPEPIEVIWDALTNREALSEWLMPTDDFAAIIGHRFHFRTKPAPGFNGLVTCEVLEVQAPNRLAFSWQGGPLRDTTVTFHLERDGNNTRLTLTHEGFHGLVPVLTAKVLKRGWINLIQRNLAQYLTRQQLLSAPLAS
jgi:uncharacterized protein YndB with AHSA1/START domain